MLVPQRDIGLGRRELKLYSSMYDKKADIHDCRGSNVLQLVASSLLVTPRRRHPLLYFLLKAEVVASDSALTCQWY